MPRILRYFSLERCKFRLKIYWEYKYSLDNLKNYFMLEVFIKMFSFFTTDYQYCRAKYI